MLNLRQVFRVAEGNAGLTYLDDKLTRFFRRLDSNFVQQIDQVMRFGRKLSQLFIVEPLKRLFNGEVTHKDGIYVSPASMHEIGCVHVIIRLFQPLFCSLFHRQSQYQTTPGKSSRKHDDQKLRTSTRYGSERRCLTRRFPYGVLVDQTAPILVADPSGILKPYDTWDITQNLQLTGGLSVSYGAKGTEYGGFTLPGTDIRSKSPDSAYLWLIYYF